MIEQARYGQPTCDCGHPWGIHDVYEYPGDDSEMCCVWGCDQRGCPGRRDRTPPVVHEDPADTGDVERILERLRAL